MATATTGSTYEADGITARPAYDFTVPEAFLDPRAADVGPVFDIRDFGAVEGSSIDNTPMIQAAIKAAHDAGGGTVFIPPGVWGVGVSADGYGAIHLADNVFVQGAGMGATTLRLLDGTTADVTGIVRTPWGEVTSNTGIADLTIDGNMANTTGAVDGFFTGPRPGETIRDADVYVMRVEIHDVSRYGFDPHEQTERLTISDSVADNNGVDGFVLDFTMDSVLTGNESYANGRHGFNFVTTSHDVLLTDNVARDNGGAGFVIQRGSEDIASSHSITLEGGGAWDNGREGVLVLMSHDVVISGMDIYGNGREGVRISGSSNVTVEGNTIAGNSQSQHDDFSEVSILAYNDTAYGRVYSAEYNFVTGNTIRSEGAVQARYGIEERAGDTGHNELLDNNVVGGVRGPMALNGVDSYAAKIGTAGNDTLVGSATQDRLEAGDGDDSISGQDGNDLADGGMGADTILGGKGNDLLSGGGGNDSLNGNSGNDVLWGGDGIDVLVGDAGDDLLDGGAGNDNVNGGTGNDIVVSDLGNDVLNGGAGFDTLDFTDAMNGVIVDMTARTASGMGSDTIASFEAVLGSDFADTLGGDRLANMLSGGEGDDVLRGMGGADTLTGGEGTDRLVWGAARDVVDKGVHLGIDLVTDFDIGQDVLDVRGLVGSQAWTQMADIVRTTDTLEGTLLSVKIAGTFRDVAHLDGVHDLDAAVLAEQGLLLV
jgi:parallel beta-helix repeat protein